MSDQSFHDGADAHRRGDYVTAHRKYLEAAEQGHAEAQFELGRMYIRGEGCQKDYATAAHWTRKAAKQGHKSAQFNLGWMYSHGHGVKGDEAQTKHWYREAGFGEERRLRGGVAGDSAKSGKQGKRERRLPESIRHIVEEAEARYGKVFDWLAER